MLLYFVQELNYFLRFIDFSLATLAATVAVGYSDLIYDLLNNSHIMALQVLFEDDMLSSSDATSTKNRF